MSRRRTRFRGRRDAKPPESRRLDATRRTYSRRIDSLVTNVVCADDVRRSRLIATATKLFNTNVSTHPSSSVRALLLLFISVRNLPVKEMCAKRPQNKPLYGRGRRATHLDETVGEPSCTLLCGWFSVKTIFVENFPTRLVNNIEVEKRQIPNRNRMRKLCQKGRNDTTNDDVVRIRRVKTIAKLFVLIQRLIGRPFPMHVRITLRRSEIRENFGSSNGPKKSTSRKKDTTSVQRAAA